MTYQPYPTGGGGSNNIVQQGPRPRSIRIAVILMYVGAGLSAVGLVGVLAISGRIKSAIAKALRNAKTSKPITASEIHSIQDVYIVFLVAVLLVAIGLWIWMAWANGGGKRWARIVATVLFGINTLWLVFTAGRAIGSAIFVLLGWIVGLVTLVFLWRRDSSEYFGQARPR